MSDIENTPTSQPAVADRQLYLIVRWPSELATDVSDDAHPWICAIETDQARAAQVARKVRGVVLPAPVLYDFREPAEQGRVDARTWWVDCDADPAKGTHNVIPPAGPVFIVAASRNDSGDVVIRYRHAKATGPTVTWGPR